MVAGEAHTMQRLPDSDFFTCSLDGQQAPDYQLRARRDGEDWRQFQDPYRFAPLTGDLDLHLFGEGRHEHLYRILGSHCCEHQGVAGVRFATWAPNANGVYELTFEPVEFRAHSFSRLLVLLQNLYQFFYRGV